MVQWKSRSHVLGLRRQRRASTGVERPCRESSRCFQRDFRPEHHRLRSHQPHNPCPESGVEAQSQTADPSAATSAFFHHQSVRIRGNAFQKLNSINSPLY